ncbi:UDP-glucose 6-dehydrogenase, partial [mine drainage metagenome]
MINVKIGIVGLGYVGLVTAVSLASVGNDVVGIDIDADRINELSEGKISIYEPNLKELFIENRDKLTFSTEYEKLSDIDFVFIIVPTPTVEGKINLNYVFKAAESIKDVNKNAIAIIKSTVVPGTAKQIKNKTGLEVISNPEFTKEGTAIYDTLHPDRVVIGGGTADAINEVWNIWSFTDAPVIKTTNENAELIKYASNAFLATKISFINEIANLCEKIPGADVDVIATGMGLDKRIAPYFLKAGIGFGGSCFPKDTKAIISYAEELGVQLGIIEAAVKANEDRINRIADMIKEKAKGTGRVSVGILGIAFKDN